MTLLSSAEGIVVEVDVDLPADGAINQVEILGTSPVSRVIYFDPRRFQDLLEPEILLHEASRSGSGNPLPWPGLGVMQYERGQDQ